MKGELVGLDRLLGAALLGETLSERCRFPACKHLADHITAEDVEDPVEMEVGPLDGPKKLGHVPRPDLVWRGGQELGFYIGRVAELVVPLPELAFLLQDTVHGSNRAQ